MAPEYRKDPRVDAYLDGLPAWQRDIFAQLRDIIHEADPAIEETIKRTVRPYFVLDGTVCAFLAAKDHVNLFVYDGGIVPDPHGLITAGHGNTTARTIGFTEGQPIRREPLLAFLRAIVADNRAGGWRSIVARGQAGS
ncbi:DUF1801 domain-containing protein [Leifsonia sp. Le1]|uniref:DUF1801 domain-containing protein n=1 Tax=Leifsonia sp. Le1 TaxID=3404918 RepID=UPI003EBF8557